MKTATPQQALCKGIVHSPLLDFSGFRSAVQNTFLPLRVSPNNDPRFEALVGHAMNGSVSVASLVAGAHIVERTTEHVKHDPRECYKLSLMVSGHGLLIQDGRETVLSPGDLALYDTSRPYALVFEGDFESVVMMLPHRSLGIPAEVVRELVATSISNPRGPAGMVATNLKWIGENLEALIGRSGARLARATSDMIATMIATELDVAKEQDPRAELMRRVREYIEENLGTPDLGPAQLAATHYVSTRHLGALFQAEGTTVAGWIRERRLERCRRALADPLLTGTPIAVIATRFGFTDAAHFSRVYRAAYGESPSQTRHWASAQGG